MMQNKYLFGITGGSGSGKSTVSEIMRSLGYDIIDCDKVARAVVEKGMPCLKEIEENFGASVIDKSGALNRKKLGEIVFGDSENLQLLNSITHKYIVEEVFRLANESPCDSVGIDGAVLFESGIGDKLRKVIAVVSDAELRIERISKRDGIDYERAKERIAAQARDSVIIEKCDWVIYNNQSEQELVKSVKEVVLKLERDIKEEKERTEQ